MPITNKYYLTKHQTDKFIKWIDVDNNASDLACPVCKNTDWHLQPSLLGTPVLRSTEDSLSNSDQVFPHVAINCTQCGYVMMFNASVAGIFEGSEDGD